MTENKDITILVVDDEPDLREIISLEFEMLGWKTLMAENGRQAYDLIKTNKINVVISDIRMPGGDGVELVDRLREASFEVPVVLFISGFADITREEAYAKGVEAIFSKPFDRKVLVRTVKQYLIPLQERWSKTPEKGPSPTEIQFQFESIEEAEKKDFFSMGRGGFFLHLDKNFPKQEDLVRFSFSFHQGIVKSLVGVGRVLWTRESVLDGLITGVGVEFLFIEALQSTGVLAYINTLKPKAFIPLGKIAA